MRETGIFTGTTSSLCLSLRQLPDRYAIRAGRNLPDKEFRYIRYRSLVLSDLRHLTRAIIVACPMASSRDASIGLYLHLQFGLMLGV